MTKKKKNNPNDMSNLLDDLFAEAVEAVESVKDDSEKDDSIKARSSLGSEDFDASEEEEFSLEVEIDINDDMDSGLNSESQKENTKKENLSMNLDDLFADSQTDTSDLSDDQFEEESSEEENWKALYVEMEGKYKKAKRAAGKRKKLLAELEQTHNTTKIELFQQRGFVERVQERLENTQRQLRRYSNALGQANEKIEDMEERIENFEKGQTRQRQLLQKEREEQKKYGHGKPILKLIPTLDNLKLALGHTESEKEVFVEGVHLAVQKFESSLSKLGITSIEATLGTDFNPEIHEAMMKVPRDDMPPNQIIDEIQSGFMIHDRLLRAARVSVSARTKRKDRKDRRSRKERVEETQTKQDLAIKTEQAESKSKSESESESESERVNTEEQSMASVPEVENTEIENTEIENTEIENTEVENTEIENTEEPIFSLQSDLSSETANTEKSEISSTDPLSE
jgi:molecular chaperone GrpE